MYALISTIYRKPSNNDADNSKSLFLYQNKKNKECFLTFISKRNTGVDYSFGHTVRVGCFLNAISLFD